jgi:YYY domain-containing protein
LTEPRRRPVARIRDWLATHPYVLPSLILLVGAVFRFYNLRWDDGFALHPDERGIDSLVPNLHWPASLQQFLDGSDPGPGQAPFSVGSPLNPHYFAYGSLPYYLLAFVAGAISLAGQHIPFLSQWSNVDSYAGLMMLGRGLSALLDLLSVFLIFVIGRRVFGYWAAILAMTLSAFTVLEIQLSHFYQVDSLLLPLVLLCLLAAVRIAEGGSRIHYVWGGIALGAALATKTTALLLVIPLGAAGILAAWSPADWPRTGSWRERLTAHYRATAHQLNGNLQWILASYVIGAVAFAVFEPYALLDRTLLFTDVSQQSTIIVSNNPPYVVPYTFQYSGTTPYVYQIQNLLFWSLGIPLALAAFAGVLAALIPALRLRIRPDRLVLLLWVILYFLFVSRFFAKFDRYMLPIVPVIVLFGAGLLVRWIAGSSGPRRMLGWTALAAVLGGSFLYSLAYMHIYAHPNTRVAASRWIFSHIPTGAGIAVEGPWDETLPLDVDGHSGASEYHFTTLNPYAGETAQGDDQSVIANISDVLMHDQYIIMSSERMVASVPKVPYILPIADRYYQLLFSNRLNFRPAAIFQAHPQLGPLLVHDYPADESFHVYDHPIVRIYRRIGPISAATVHRLLTTGLPAAPSGIDPSTLPWVLRPNTVPADTRLTLSPTKWQADQQGGTLTGMFPPGGFGMQHPILTWLILLELLGLVGFPFAFIMLGRLIDRGYPAAKTLALLALGYLVWILVNGGISVYERGLIVAALAVLTACSGALAWFRRREMAAFFRSRWRYVLAGEAVFLVGFGVFILLRMWYPDLGHQWTAVSATNVGQGRMGEKQMELAFLNAIVRSRVFPPYDPFFAHGSINYYYYGFFLVATLCKLTQIMPATGFNLAVATFFGLLVSTVFSAGLNLTRRVGPGVLAAILVGAIGNLAGAWQAIQDLMSVAQIHSAFPFFGGVINVLSGVQQAVFAHASLPAFDYWGPTRIVPGGDISEFPYFTYLFADLHPHLMAYPLTAAAILFAINLGRGGVRSLGSRLLSLLGAAVLLGAIAVTNPWDYPTYLLLIGLGALIGGLVVRRRLTAVVLLRPVAWLGCIGILTLILYLPFKQSYQTVFATGLGLVRDVTPDLLQPAVCPFPQQTCPAQVHDALVTPLNVYLQHFGLLLFAVLSFLAFTVYVDLGLGRRLRQLSTTAQFAFYYRDRLPHLWHSVRVIRCLRGARERALLDLPVLWAVIGVVLVLVLLQYFLLAFLVACLGLVTLVATGRADRLTSAHYLVLAMVGTGLLLSLVTQIVFVKDWLAGGPSFRMNTIFKFYDQVWVLFAVSGACCLYYLMDRLIPRSAAVEVHATKPFPRSAVRSGAAAGTAHFVLQPEPALGSDVSRRPGRFGDAVREDPKRELAYVDAPYHHMRSAPSGAVERADSDPALDTAESGASPMSRARRVKLRGRWPRFRGPWRRPAALATTHPMWSFCLALLFAGTLVYTYAGTVARETVRSTWLPQNSVPFTLDGMAFMKVAYPNEYAAITWMNANIKGAPVVAEGDGGPAVVAQGAAYYDWRSRVSMFTGLPTIVNGIHEPEQRYADEIDPSSLCGGARNPALCQATAHSRGQDLVTLYNSPRPEDAWQVIARYGVRYIYVGFIERMCNRDPRINQCYSPAGLAKFNRMVGHGLRVAYRNPDVTIYQVTKA